jgi:DNA-binding response OmpR family regulator
MPTSTQYKLLVVEDEAPLAQILIDAFNAEGFVTSHADNGKDGLDQALSWQPDIILLDIVMPKMDGITMLHKLREHAEGKKIPVILLTNLSDTDKVFDALAYGAFDFLIKADWSIADIVREVKSKLPTIGQ